MIELLRRILRFFFLDKVKATLWTSAIVLAISVLNQFGLIFPALRSLLGMSVKTYSVINAILGPLGILSFVITVMSYAFYRRRKEATGTGLHH